jgi:ribosomal protein S18 acetylase RimI-like enzyme
MFDASTDEQSYNVVSVRQLSETQAQQARALRDLCDETDGLYLKLGISADFATRSAEPYAFLCVMDDTLVGFCTLVGGDDPELELCGMVHPAYRRRGIGRALLRAARDSAKRRLAAIRVLLICEASAAAGRAFVAAAGGTHSFDEHRMEITAPQASTSQQRLDIRQAEADDAPELARVIGASFGQTDDHLADDIVRDMTTEHERYFLAWLGGAPVGAFKIFTDAPKASIYAFGVLPEYRRHGYGHEILETTLPRLFAEGWTAVGLEVDAANTAAQALYRAVGFRDVAVYGYYTFDVSAW